MQQIQRQYGGGTITSGSSRPASPAGCPTAARTAASKLGQFFRQWFDTGYPTGGATKPTITGPGLAGGGFYDARGGC